MKIAMIFPGYSSQFVGMGKELYDEYRIVQEYFEEASNCLNVNFVKLCFASSDVELARMSNAYTATFLVSCSIVDLLKQEGIKPDLVAGYNQGEYAALFAGGGITFPDGLYLLNKYAGFYREALEGMNVAVVRVHGVPTQQLEGFCLKAGKGDSKLFISVYNSTDDHIVAGHIDAVERMRDLIGQAFEDADITSLSEEVGLHSSLMDPVVDNFEIYLEKVDFKDLQVPMISGVDGQLIQKGSVIREQVVRHINSPIVFTRVIDALEPHDLIIEIGPGTTLSTMVKKRYPDKQIIAINKKSDIEELKELVEKHKQVGGETDG